MTNTERIKRLEDRLKELYEVQTDLVSAHNTTVAGLVQLSADITDMLKREVEREKANKIVRGKLH